MELNRRQRLRTRITIFGTWNVQGLSRKINEVIHELTSMRIDIAVITETEQKGQDSENLVLYDHFYNRVPKEYRAQQGVSLLTNEKFRKHITRESVSERIIKVNMSIKGYRAHCFGCICN